MLETIKEEVFGWLETNGWKGFDPFDGLNTPLQKILGRGFPAVAFLQFVKRFPFNIRPWLFVSPQENPMSWAAGILGAVEAGKTEFLDRAVPRLLDLRTPGTHLWGYPFPWASKAFYLKAKEPNLVLSALCLRALNRASVNPQQSVQALHDCFYKKREGFFSYVAREAILVHNANLLGAEAAARHLPFQPDALRAAEISLEAQEPSGRWPYGTLPHHQWCDNFHTAYNLIALSNIHSALPNEKIKKAVQNGLNYYLAHAFTTDGKPRYYDNQTYPLETHSAAVGLILLGEMVKGGWLDRETARNQAEKIVDWLRREAYLGEGRFAYRKGRRPADKTVFARWTQAWVYCGLEAAASLLED